MEDDVVFNLTALNGTQNFYNRPTQVLINSAVTAIVAATVCAEKGISRYFYFGSSESYAGGIELGLTSIPTPEKVTFAFPDTQNLRWSYGMSKAIGEVACTAAHFEMGLQYSIIRVHNIYGPRMGLEHVIPDLVTRFQIGDMRVYGKTESRAFMYVADLVKVVRFIQDEPHLLNSIVNVGSDVETSILDLATEICNQLEIKKSIIDVGRISGSVNRRCPDLSLIRSYMSLELTPLKSGLSETIDYYKEFPPKRLPQEFPQ
jgi:nucleoside-diphosphate-sugar epimerase